MWYQNIVGSIASLGIGIKYRTNINRYPEDGSRSNCRNHIYIKYTVQNGVGMEVIPGLGREVDEICPLLGYYAAYSCNSLLTFRDNLAVPSSKFKKPKKKDW